VLLLLLLLRVVVILVVELLPAIMRMVDMLGVATIVLVGMDMTMGMGMGLVHLCQGILHPKQQLVLLRYLLQMVRPNTLQIWGFVDVNV
jgi:hypothetical protein